MTDDISITHFTFELPAGFVKRAGWRSRFLLSVETPATLQGLVLTKRFLFKRRRPQRT